MESTAMMSIVTALRLSRVMEHLIHQCAKEEKRHSSHPSTHARTTAREVTCYSDQLLISSPPVQSLGIIGGGALLLAASGFSGVSTLLAAGGDRGASPDLPAGVGGAAVAGGAVVTRAMCTTPFCSAASGQCCLLIGSNRGVVCPRSC